MNVPTEVVGEAGAVAAEEVVEPCADSFKTLVFDVGFASAGCRAADGFALTGDVDLEVDGRAGWVMAESAQEHSGLGEVVGLTEGAQRPLFEMEDDAGRGADWDSRRYRRDLDDGGLEKLIDVVGRNGAVDSRPDSDKGLSGRQVTGFGEEHDAAVLAGRARSANDLRKSAQLACWTWKADDDRIEPHGLDELQGVIVPGLMVELDVAVANRH